MLGCQRTVASSPDEDVLLELERLRREAGATWEDIIAVSTARRSDASIDL